MSIHTIGDKIKGPLQNHRQALIILAVLVSSCLISFYLGYTARGETEVTEPVVIQCPANAYITGEGGIIGSSAVPLAGEGAYVASKNGQRYYPIDCAGASRIKEENKVWFKTAQDAEARGYTLALTCQ